MEDPANTPPPVAILGGGSMGTAIVEGLLAPGPAAPRRVSVTVRSAASAASLRSRGVAAMALEDDERANSTAASTAAVIVLAVKPAGVLALVREIAPAVPRDAVLVSVAAGVPVQAIELAAGRAAVVRAMPNTPATIGLGVTGIAAGSRVSAEQLARVEDVFASVGTVHRVDESQLDALTAISGSGPAYVFYLAEKLADAGRALGLPGRLADDLAAQTFRGAAQLLAESDAGAAELRRRVTSPGGTTARAIDTLEEHDVAGAIEDAARAAARRSAEMTREYGG